MKHKSKEDEIGYWKAVLQESEKEVATNPTEAVVLCCKTLIDKAKQHLKELAE